MVWEDMCPSNWLTKEHFLNGVAVYLALGGSTNAVIHLIAMANRAGIKLTLAEMGDMAKKIPVIANLFPVGNNLMEDFFFAGGLCAMMNKMKQHLHLDCINVSGQTWQESLEGAVCYDDDVIRDLDNPVIPLSQGSTLAVLYGNLCPDGAVMKTGAGNPKFRKHSGVAIVFDSPEEMSQKLDDPDLEVTEDSVLVLRNGGPVGAPGMPEWGNLPIPKKLLDQGVKDMVRIADCRMSGTHYGSCVLHVAPEAAIGGPLALLKTGDIVDLDVEAGSLNMRVSEEELAQRKTEWKPKHLKYERSFAALYQQHVTQADKGCDFDFLESSEPTPEPGIY